MPLQEGGDDIRAEGERDTAVVLAPADDVLIWVGPQEVTQETGVRHVGWAHNALNLVHRRQLGGEPAVHAKDLLVDDGCDRKAVKAVRERLPELNVVAAFTCDRFARVRDRIGSGTREAVSSYERAGLLARSSSQPLSHCETHEHSGPVVAMQSQQHRADNPTALTFVVEAVDPIDGRALVVAAQDKEILWVLDLVREQQADCFKALLSTVDIVSAGT